MASERAERLRAPPFIDPPGYARHRPEATLLYQLERCARCGGRLRVISSIEEPALIARILAHRRQRGQEDAPVASLGPRAPPPPPGSSGLLF